MPVTDMRGDLSERLEVYIESVSRESSNPLLSLRSKAEREHIPIIRRSAERYIRMLLQIAKPIKILEIGTATGYSAAVMASECKDSVIDTVECDETRASEAVSNFKRLNLSNRINVLCCDAKEFLQKCEESYDLVFLDAAKGQYIVWWDDIVRVLAAGGIIIADNVLQEGSVLDSRFAVERRDRTIHERMRTFVKAVFSDERFCSDILPIGDGLLIAKRLI